MNSSKFVIELKDLQISQKQSLTFMSTDLLCPVLFLGDFMEFTKKETFEDAELLMLPMNDQSFTGSLEQSQCKPLEGLLLKKYAKISRVVSDRMFIKNLYLILTIIP